MDEHSEEASGLSWILRFDCSVQKSLAGQIFFPDFRGLNSSAKRVQENLPFRILFCHWLPVLVRPEDSFGPKESCRKNNLAAFLFCANFASFAPFNNQR